ncbi:MAG: hypothetical protein NC453_25820, partial [Muribaculum sp.]|nr:hypothetical protein [Muribaculum sp.]
SGRLLFLSVKMLPRTVVQTKLQAAIAASNAMQSIQNSLQAQSALMQGVNLVQTRLRTVAENLHTAAQGKGVIATAALTAAQWAFNAAANANPIGLVVVAITACVAAVWGLVKAFQAFFGPSDEALEKYKQQKEALDELCEANDQLIDRMKARGATEAELLNQSLQNKEAEKKAADALFEQAKELYDEDEDEYKEALEAKKKADEEFETHKEDSLNYLLSVIHEAEEEEKKQRLGTYEYKRQLIQAELEQQKAIALALLQQEKITKQVYENLVASLDKAAQLKIDKVNNDEKESKTKKVGGGRFRSTGGGSSRGSNNNAADDLKKQVQAGEDALLKIIEDSLERQRAAENLSYQRKLKELQDALKKTKDTQVKLRTAINNQIEGLEAEHARKLNEIYYSQIERYQKAESDFIASHLEIVQEGSQEELDWKLKQLQNQRDQELTALWKAEEDKTLTVEQATEMRANLMLKYQKLEEEAEAEHAQKVVDIIEDKYAKEQTERDTNLIIATTQLKQQYAEELRLAGNNEDKREEARMRHDARMLQLQNNYAQETLRNTIEMLEKMLEAEDLNADVRLEIEQRLARAKAELEEKMVDQTVDTLEKTGNKFQQWLDKNKKYIDAFGQMASDIFNGLNDLMQTLYDNQISKIEEQQEFNEEAGEAEQERITELVQKKVITEEEGEARKRAAEAATAKKNEELEKKKQQLKIKQAKWDKANSIAQATISTALAIMNALQTQPFWLGIAMAAVAGAMGAVQIATIAATPLPTYAKGTDYHKGGPAVVGDGGRSELVIFNDKAWLTPDTPMLVDLPKGASVIPDPLGIKELVSVPNIEPIPERQIIVNSYDDRNFRRDVSELAYLIRQNTKQQRDIAYRQEYELFKAAKGL